MGTHVPISDVQPASSRFRSLILGILWIKQLTFYSVWLIISGLLIGITVNSPGYIDKVFDNSSGEDRDKNSPLQPWIIVNIVMACVGLALTCLEIVMHSNRDLTPTIYLWSQIIKSSLSVPAIAFVCYSATSSWMHEGKFNKYYVYVGIAFAALIFSLSTWSLIYASIMYHRYRMRMRGFMERYV